MLIAEDIDLAVDTLRRGGLVAYPTDTVWGIGCDATSDEAVRRVYTVKQRPDSKALITLVADRQMLEALVGDVTDDLWQMMTAGPRPTTVVFPRAVETIAPSLLAPDGSLGVRVTAEKYSSELCRRLGRPIVSTSANISGQPSPAIFSEISPALLSKLDYTATYRRDDTSRSLPSRVVKLNGDGSITTLRP